MWALTRNIMLLVVLAGAVTQTVDYSKVQLPRDPAAQVIYFMRQLARSGSAGMHMNAGVALLNLGSKGGNTADVKFYFTQAMIALRFALAEVRAGRGERGLTEAMVHENIRALQKNAKYLKVDKIFKYATSASGSKPDVDSVLRKLSPDDYMEIDGRGGVTKLGRFRIPKKEKKKRRMAGRMMGLGIGAKENAQIEHRGKGMTAGVDKDRNVAQPGGKKEKKKRRMAGRMMGLGIGAKENAQTEHRGKGMAAGVDKDRNVGQLGGAAGGTQEPARGNARRGRNKYLTKHNKEPRNRPRKPNTYQRGKKKSTAPDTPAPPPPASASNKKAGAHVWRRLSPCAVAWLLNDDADANAWQTDSLGEWLDSKTMRAATSAAAKGANSESMLDVVREKWATRVQLARTDDAAAWRGLSAEECEDLESESGLVDDAARCTHFGVLDGAEANYDAYQLSCSRATLGSVLVHDFRSARAVLSSALTSIHPSRWAGLGITSGALMLLDGLEGEGRRINEQFREAWRSNLEQYHRIFSRAKGAKSLVLDDTAVRQLFVAIFHATRHPELDAGVLPSALASLAERKRSYSHGKYGDESLPLRALEWIRDSAVDAVLSPTEENARRLPYPTIAVLNVFQKLLFDYELAASQNRKHDLSLFEGERAPKYTLSAIEYLDSLDLLHARVFEFGAGGSTLWWAARTKSVDSIETSIEWVQSVQNDLGDRATHARVHFRTDKAAAALAILDTQFESQLFDVVVVDGGFNRFVSAAATVGVIGANGERTAVGDAVRRTASKLAPGGFIVLDDSDWHPNTAKMLREEAGLIQVDFHSMKPGDGHVYRATSIFMHRDFAPAPRAGLPLPQSPRGGAILAPSTWDAPKNERPHWWGYM